MSGITGQKRLFALARARGFAGILLGTEQAPRADEVIHRRTQMAVMN